MKWNALIRQVHRWTSIVFTLAVILNFVALGLDSQEVWIGLLALLPLFVLLLTGLYLFALPYIGRGRAARPA